MQYNTGVTASLTAVNSFTQVDDTYFGEAHNFEFKHIGLITCKTLENTVYVCLECGENHLKPIICRYITVTAEVHNFSNLQNGDKKQAA